MKKIISLFQRNYEGDRLVRDEIVPGAEWVVAGEGVATRKWDGTCVLVRDGKLYKRYDAKAGRTPPANWEPAQERDEVTGHQPGWVPVGDGPEDKWFKAAFEQWTRPATPASVDGTYELCGPHFQSNPERLESDSFIRHGTGIVLNPPRDFAGLQAWFSEGKDLEGIVWHHPDGRMVKIKARDFGLKRIVSS